MNPIVLLFSVKEAVRMAFQLNSIVPWGRNLNEYQLMFQLDDHDMSQKIASFGDGPASFNCEASQLSYSVTSFDPIYQFPKDALQRRIAEVRTTVMQQMAENRDNYVWTHMQSLDVLEQTRMSAMQLFLSDYEQGRQEARYICHELPNRVPFDDHAFDIGLSSHFLLLYTALGYDFHVQAMTEMLRVCKEIRIFPIVDLDAQKSSLTDDVIAYFKQQYLVEVRKTEYEFQKGGNQLLVIKNRT